MNGTASAYDVMPSQESSQTGVDVPQLFAASPFVTLTAGIGDALERPRHATRISVPSTARSDIEALIKWMQRGGLVVLVPSAQKFTTLDVVPESTPIVGSLPASVVWDQSERSGAFQDALAAVADLQRWLSASYADVAAAVDIGETTIYHWRRVGAQPRPATTRQLWRVHAFTQALVDRLGESAVRQWFLSGSPSPLERLQQGHIGQVEDAAHELLFRQPGLRPHQFSAFKPDEDEPDLQVPKRTTAPRRSSRRSQRGRRHQQ